jgi:sodium transport system permease protein
MSWTNVKLIFFREIRDQSRDRRTLFVIAVLPVVLYPLLWMSFLQVAQFMQEKPSKVLVVGARSLAGLPPLAESRPAAGRRAVGAGSLRSSHADSSPLLDLHFASDEPPDNAPETFDPRAEARRAVERGEYDAAIYFPPDFADRMDTFRQSIGRQLETDEQARASAGEGSVRQGPEGAARPSTRQSAGKQSATKEAAAAIPKPEIIYSTATERSNIAFLRVRNALDRWRREIVRQKLIEIGLPTAAEEPFDVKAADVAEGTGRRGTAMWSRVLPVLLLIWAMTGAFYPAIDLCAGEKERGTLETLLSSPAERSEIVLGKLVTIMLFSMITAVWNLLAMGISGWLLLAQLARLAEFGPPPATSAVWLAIVLVPVSALFSALALALAALARSSKEGQYYFLPLLLVTMPLVVLPMAPGVRLDLGNSLIPVTGVALLLKSMLEGSFWQVWPLLFPVAAVTLVCCVLAIRWAVEQFNSEAVLFREGERLDLGVWLRHLLADRQPTPRVAAAVSCGILILLVRFFVSFSFRVPQGFSDSVVLVLVSELAVIAAPALLMTLMLTSSPRRTLLLRSPRWTALAGAAALAVAIHPLVMLLNAGVTRLYPISPELAEQLNQMLAGAPNLWSLLLIVAVLPAICEELAFRGFILSGFRHLGHPWRAIVYTALFFGLTHAILQQQIVACLVGVVIGFIAIESGSIWPCMVFHAINNSLSVLVGQMSTQITPQLLDRWPALAWVLSPHPDGLVYRWPVILAGALAAMALLAWFNRLPYSRSPEEEKYEAIRRASLDEE